MNASVKWTTPNDGRDIKCELQKSYLPQVRSFHSERSSRVQCERVAFRRHWLNRAHTAICLFDFIHLYSTIFSRFVVHVFVGATIFLVLFHEKKKNEKYTSRFRFNRLMTVVVVVVVVAKSASVRSPHFYVKPKTTENFINATKLMIKTIKCSIALLIQSSKWTERKSNEKQNNLFFYIIFSRNRFYLFFYIFFSPFFFLLLFLLFVFYYITASRLRTFCCYFDPSREINFTFSDLSGETETGQCKHLTRAQGNYTNFWWTRNMH